MHVHSRRGMLLEVQSDGHFGYGDVAPELSVDKIPINTRFEDNLFQLNATIPLPKALFGQKLKIGLSAVVQDENGVIYYYALRHLREQADFHDINSFQIEVQTL